MAGSGPPAVCDYREGAWVHDPNAQAPYRLQREFGSNPFVKGWKYAYRSFWGLCDATLPPNVSRRSTQYHWQPSSCNLRRFSAPRFCSQFVRPGVQRDIVMAGDSFTGQLFISLLALLGGTFVREHMPTGRTILHGGAYVHDMPTQEFHVDAVACVETAPLPGLRQWWANSKGGPSGVHPVRPIPNPNDNPNPNPDPNPNPNPNPNLSLSLSLSVALSLTLSLSLTLTS